MSNVELYRYLLKYVLTEDQLLNLGYPVESALYPGKAIIYKAQDAQVTYYRSDLRNFFQHKRGGFEMAEHLYGSDQAQFCTGQHPPLSPSLEKRCVRCGKGFFVTLDGEYLTEESCTYHWGRWKPLDNDRFGYSCCERSENDLGCSVNKLHVWTGVNSGMNGPLNDYIRTKKLRHPQYNVYALDCEMCYTGKGLELCKLTVVGIDGCLVYETLVKPHRSIVDYNTRFSGLNVNNLGKATKRLRDVQNDLMGFINGETILIGHGLENDLRALGLLHSNVIDTAVLFPHYYGLPFRRSLKSLVSAHLQREIQTRLDGHDSFEDARACVELVLWKVCCELRRKSEHLP
nr:EOG090X01LQ [Cyclestheria hislopi]